MISRENKSHSRHSLFAASVLAMVALLYGCGGSTDSGATSSTPSADEPAPAPAPAADSAPRGTASITGSIRFEGEAPRAPELDMAADPACAAKHSGPMYNEALVLGDGQTLGNVLVSVKSGLPGGSYSAPSEPVVLDQVGCRYVPRVVGLQVGQPLKVLNSDALLHNVHSLSKVNSPFNRAMPGSVTEAQFQLNKEEAVFRVKCDVHPWMSAYVGVLSHPYFDVTSEDGGFEISGLPAGTYEIEAWHERLGTQTASVTVADGETASASFSFSR